LLFFDCDFGLTWLLHSADSVCLSLRLSPAVPPTKYL
jgi:hypothetical protein